MIISPREITVKRWLLEARIAYTDLVSIMLEPIDGWDVERAGMANLQFIW